MAAKKKTRGKSQLGKGRHSEREVARQQKAYDRKLARAAGFNPTGKMTDLDKVPRGWALEKGGEFKHSRDPGDKAWRKEQKARSGPTTRWSKARIAAANRSLAGDASNTPGEKAAPRGGGRAKAAATRARNIAKSKAAGTYSGGKGAKRKQSLKNRLRIAAARVPLAASYAVRGGGGKGGTK